MIFTSEEIVVDCESVVLTSSEIERQLVTYEVYIEVLGEHETRVVSVAQLMTCLFPNEIYQVGDKQLSVMKAKARRIMDIHDQYRCKAGPKGKLP